MRLRRRYQYWLLHDGKEENWSEQFLLKVYVVCYFFLDHILYHRAHFIRNTQSALQAVLAIIYSFFFSLKNMNMMTEDMTLTKDFISDSMKFWKKKGFKGICLAQTRVNNTNNSFFNIVWSII